MHLTRGRLRIYFGAAPGVGKTRTMLADAHARSARGVDVVIGRVETHGLADTEALCRGLETLGTIGDDRAPAARRFDLEAAIRRQPGLILIDDIAQGNPEGSRHFQRWQDVEEILDHGIDVYATLNVHSIESLRDLVHDITKIRFRQTVPDSLLEQADEIVLVDMPPDDLLERVREGKVYLAQPERMLRDYFRKEVLASLRDLALQLAAEHLEARRRAQGRREDGAGLWPGNRKVLVCIGHEPMADQLIRAGKRMATFLHADWIVAYRESAAARQPAERERIESLLRLAEGLGAEVATVSGFAVGRRIAELALQKNVGRVVLERATGTVRQRWRHAAIVRALERGAPALDIFLISPEHSSFLHEAPGAHDRLAPAGALPAGSTVFDWRPYFWCVAITATATILSTTLFRHAEPSNHLLIYLLGVLFIASRYGFWPSAVAALLSVLASDFLLIAPYYSFAIARPQDVVTLGVFLLAALTASRLADDLRFQSERAKEREQRMRFLYEFSKALADLRTMPDVASVAVKHICTLLPWQCQLLLAGPAGRIVPDAAPGETPRYDFDMDTAQWVFDNRKPAGRGTDAVAPDRGLYLPVSGPAHRFGVLALRPTRMDLMLLPEQRRMIDTIVSQVSQALERIRLVQEAQNAASLAETESLRNSLLSAIAHDFRTPLASIVAASSTLLQGRGLLSESQTRDLTQAILEEGQRMTRLANNTLEVARLEAGTVRLKREWYPLDEIVGAVFSRMDDRLRDHRFETRLPAGVPMAQVDLVMIVQVLENLIENAAKYTPPGTRIEIGAEELPGEVAFWVADEGPGIPPGENQRIFEKFYRGPGQEAKSGVGLGLTICRIVVEAHGGHIAAHNRPAGGAEFRFTIPATEPAPRVRADV